MHDRSRRQKNRKKHRSLVPVAVAVVVREEVAVLVLENVVVTLLKAVTVVVLKGTVVVLDRRRRVVAAESSHLLAEGLDRLKTELREQVFAVDLTVVAVIGADMVVEEHARDELALGLLEHLDAKLHRRVVFLRKDSTSDQTNTLAQIQKIPLTKHRFVQVLNQEP